MTLFLDYTCYRDPTALNEFAFEHDDDVSAGVNDSLSANTTSGNAWFGDWAELVAGRDAVGHAHRLDIEERFVSTEMPTPAITRATSVSY